MGGLVIGVLILLTAILAVLIFILLRRQPTRVDGVDLATPLQNLTQVIEGSRRETAVLAEKLSKLEPVTDAIGKLQGELRVIGERVGSVESNLNENMKALTEVRNDTTKAETT